MSSCRPPALCCEDGCTRDAAPSHRRCHGHLMRQRRGQSMSEPLREPYATPWERLTAAALAYAEADDGDEEDFARAQDRLRKAAQAYAQRESPPAALSVPAPRAMRKKPELEGQLALWGGDADGRS